MSASLIRGVFTVTVFVGISSLPGVPQPVGETGEGGLTCFSADDCHGELVPGLASQGDCCSSKGLSYEKLEGDGKDRQCVSCFRKFIRKRKPSATLGCHVHKWLLH